MCLVINVLHQTKSWYIALDRDEGGSFITPDNIEKHLHHQLYLVVVYFQFTNHLLVKINVIKVMPTYVLQMTNVVEQIWTTNQRQLKPMLIITRHRTGSQDTVTIGTENNACKYINEGVLSNLLCLEPISTLRCGSEDSSTLYRVQPLPGDIISNKGLERQ